MKAKLLLASLLLAGAGCSFSPAPASAPQPAPAPAPDPAQADLDAHADLIHVDNVMPGTQVSSPLTITGKARGNWYFEASFPVKLVDANNVQLALQPAQAQSDWMTTDFVPFSVTLTYPTPATPTGTLILMKDNPSGEPQFDDQIAIPVTF